MSRLSELDMDRQLLDAVSAAMEEPEAKLKLAIVRSDALFNFYSAERRIGTDPLRATERMHEFAKRLDALEYDRDLQVIRDCMERTS